MPWKQPTGWYLVALYSGLAGFGGAFGYIMRALDKNERINPWRVVVEAGAAAFVGVLVTLLCQAMAVSQQWTGVVVGVCGWLGANATIRLLESVVARKIGARPADEAAN